MKIQLYCCFFLLWMSVFLSFSGCSGNTSQSRVDGQINWNNINAIEVVLQPTLKPNYYLLEDDKVTELIELIQKETETDGEAIQVMGGEMILYASGQEKTPRYRFYVNVHSVKGMGGKRDHDWEKGLLDGQEKRRNKVWSIIKKIGKPISEDQFNSYAQEFDKLEYTYLYWKN